MTIGPSPGRRAGVRIELAGLSATRRCRRLRRRISSEQPKGGSSRASVLPRSRIRPASFRAFLRHRLRRRALSRARTGRRWHGHGFAAMLTETPAGAHAGLRLLAGRPGADRPDEGALVCSCHEVGVNRIAAAIASGAANLDAVGIATRAGTNCGSCRPRSGECSITAARRNLASLRPIDQRRVPWPSAVVAPRGNVMRKTPPRLPWS